MLDWANARAGDPRADLARTAATLQLAGGLASGPGGRALLRLLEPAWRRGYERAAGPTGDLGLFFAWAGEATANDLAPKLGRPGLPLRPDDLERLRRWAAAWRRQAVLA